MSLTVNAVVAPPFIPFPGNPFMSMWVIVTKTGDVTAWQVTAGEPQTPRPESLTYDNGYRADDLWVRTAIPYDLSYRIIRQ